MRTDKYNIVLNANPHMRVPGARALLWAVVSSTGAKGGQAKGRGSYRGTPCLETTPQLLPSHFQGQGRAETNSTQTRLPSSGHERQPPSGSLLRRRETPGSALSLPPEILPACSALPALSPMAPTPPENSWDVTSCILQVMSLLGYGLSLRSSAGSLI